MRHHLPILIATSELQCVEYGCFHVNHTVLAAYRTESDFLHAMLDRLVDVISVDWKQVVCGRLAPTALAFVLEEKGGEVAGAFWRARSVMRSVCFGLRWGYGEC